MTEDQKYQGALYKNKKAKTSNFVATPPAPPKTMPQPAFVEDATEEYEWRDYEDDSDDDNLSPAEPPPEAPTPPPADQGPVNVFDFLVGNPTPSASNVSLLRPTQLSKETQLVRFDYDAEAYLDPEGQMVEEGAMVEYGAGPVAASQFETPAPKGERRRSKDGEKDVKKDKKRKRLHVDVHDQVMTDAPPVLHSGLTGGLNKLMTRPSVFPPSPDYSGGDVAETPTSPLKKTKHSKHGKPSRAEAIGNTLMAMISSGPKTKTKKRKHSSPSGTKKSSRHLLEGAKEQKLLEYRPGSKEGKEGGDNAMILYKPRAEHFLSFVNKGPDSERGCSMNKALKRYHRERSASASQSVSKLMEEKELWRSLRLRKNDRGEIVLFCV